MRIELSKIDVSKLDKIKLSYYENYFQENFNSHFEYNLGTDIILNHMAGIKSVNNWIDLGAGASTLFWALPLEAVNNIFCNEITVEPLFVLDKEILKKDELPKCYYDVFDIYIKDYSHINYLKKKINFYIFNAMNTWSIKGLSFDLITQFGTFGLSKDKNTYIKCMNYAFENLSVGGRMIGANWIMKESFSKSRGIDNHYLDTSIIQIFVKDKDCAVIDNQIVDIVDENYEGVLIWYLQKK